MANNEVKQEKLIEIKVESETPCTDQYKKDKAALKAAGFSELTAEAIADADWNNCMEETYGSN